MGIFFSEKTCIFGANVIILYPTRGGCLDTFLLPAHSCASFFIFLLFSSFTFLSFTLLFPQGSKKGDDPSCTGSPPFLFVRVWLLFSGSGLQRPAGRRPRSKAFPVRRPGLLRPVPMRGQRLPRCWVPLPPESLRHGSAPPASRRASRGGCAPPRSQTVWPAVPAEPASR